VTPPLVSVVIPTYNYGHCVADAVDSALAQTYPAVEVIVVDDGSTDDTPDRLAKYGDRIRVIRQPNQGLSAARNAGIRAAAGELVALLDSDDAFHPRKLEHQTAYLAANPAVGLVGTNHFSDPTKMWPAVETTPAARAVSLDELVIKARFSPSSAVLRKACVAAVGDFDTTLRSVEDRDFWIRVATKFGVAVLDADLTFYREQPGSMSRNVERMEQFEKVVLEKAFALPELRGRRLLRRKARGLASYSSAFMHHISDRPAGAARRMVESFAWWPVPFRVPDVRMPLARARLFAAVVKKWVAGGGR
jgi:glycosyltransferase involved in cell wall biosynthesis